MNFNLFDTNKDLQRFKAFLNQAENEGITDIRTLYGRIEDHLNKRFKGKRMRMSSDRRQMALAKKLQKELADKENKEIEKLGYVIKKRCPECDSVNWHRGIDNTKGVTTVHYYCKQCGYGEAVN